MGGRAGGAPNVGSGDRAKKSPLVELRVEVCLPYSRQVMLQDGLRRGEKGKRERRCVGLRLGNKLGIFRERRLSVYNRDYMFRKYYTWFMLLN